MTEPVTQPTTTTTPAPTGTTPSPTTTTPPSDATKPADKPVVAAADKPADGTKPPETKPGDKPADKPGDKTDENFLFDGDKPKDEEKPGEKKDGEDKPKDGEQPPPVTVETLTMPDDVVVSETMKPIVNDVIAQHKLSKEQSQAVIDLGVKLRQDDLKGWQDVKAKWLGEIKSDPEIGGANADSVKRSCNNVIRQFGGSDENKAELQQDLILLGLGNKRSFVKLLNNIAKATGQDTVTGGEGGGGSEKGKDLGSIAQRMYPGMNP